MTDPASRWRDRPIVPEAWLAAAGRSARRGADALLSVLLAARCAACRRALDAPTRGPVCAACWGAVPLLTPPLCVTCSAPLPSWRVFSHAAARCPRCRRRPGAVDRARAAGLYEGSLREIVHALKYEGRRSLARRLAILMIRSGGDLLAGADCLVPVPLHPSRRRSRGFNQARDLAEKLGLPVVEGLRRVRRAPPQTGLPAGRRHANVRGAFAPASRHDPPVRNLVVVLVDDVMTTGATLEACARALKEAGAREVRALTAARAASGRP